MLKSIDKPTLKRFVQKYSNTYPLLLEYHNTEQDPVWHGEGDVGVHTQMVLDVAYSIIENKEDFSLTERECEILMFACVFHDYAKPITTIKEERFERECVVSPRHETVAASLLVNLEKPVELSNEEWLTVIKLVAFHQMPKKAINGNFSKGQYIRLLRQCENTKLLFLLEVADIKGRKCPDQESEYTFVELFKDECVEHSLFGDTRTCLDSLGDTHPCERALFMGLSDFADNKIHSLETIASMSYGNSTPPKLTVMCGLPASGKSSYIRKKHQGTTVISLDGIRKEICGNEGDQSKNEMAVRIAKERLRVAFRQGVDVVYDATSLRTDFRTKVTNLAADYGYMSEIVVMLVDAKTCAQRDKERGRTVGEDKIKDMANLFQYPILTESDNIIFSFGI